MTSFYTDEELKVLGLKCYGKNVMISRKASLYNLTEISVGNSVRIDDFCIVSGKVNFGDYIHLAAYSALYAGDTGITIENYATISSRVCVYAISDDYSGETMTSPMIPEQYRDRDKKHVTICKYAIIGTGSTILPGVMVAEGTAIGAMSLCKESTDPWMIYAGIPARAIKARKKDLLALTDSFENSIK